MRRMKMDLPNKPSKLLILALTDLEKVERDPRYTIDMTAWHKPSRFGIERCFVCVAGAVIACESEAEVSETIRLSDFSGTTKDKLECINLLRSGMVTEGLNALGLRGHDYEYLNNLELDFLSYFTDTRLKWKIHMQDLIGVLQAEGL